MRGILVFLLVVVLPTVTDATGVWKVTTFLNNGKLKVKKLQENNEWGAEYELDPVVAWGVHQPPGGPGTMVRMSGGSFYNYSIDWYEWTEEDWDAMNIPHLMVLLSGELASGTWVSKDTGHVTAEAEAGDGTTIYELQWTYATLSITSNRLTFSNNGTSPSITFDPLQAPNTRADALGYRITGSIGSISEFVETRQNTTAKLRQQYHDRGIRVPGQNSRWISGSTPVNQPEITDEFPILQDKYTDWVRLTNNNALTTLPIHSSARTPRKQVSLGEAGSKYSLHQYGCAYDLTPIPFGGGPNPNDPTDDRAEIEAIWEITMDHTPPRGEAHEYGNNAVHIGAISYEGGITVLIP